MSGFLVSFTVPIAVNIIGQSLNFLRLSLRYNDLFFDFFCPIIYLFIQEIFTEFLLIFNCQLYYLSWNRYHSPVACRREKFLTSVLHNRPVQQLCWVQVPHWETQTNQIPSLTWVFQRLQALTFPARFMKIECSREKEIECYIVKNYHYLSSNFLTKSSTPKFFP